MMKTSKSRSNTLIWNSLLSSKKALEYGLAVQVNLLPVFQFFAFMAIYGGFFVNLVKSHQISLNFSILECFLGSFNDFERDLICFNELCFSLTGKIGIAGPLYYVYSRKRST